MSIELERQDGDLAQGQRNYALGVINGALFNLVLVLTDTDMVVSWFLLQLGVSSFWIGLVPVIYLGVGMLPQLFVSSLVQRHPLKMPAYRVAAISRWTTLLMAGAAVALIPLDSAWLVPAFYVPVLLFGFGGGFVGIPFLDMVAKVIPQRRRGSFFAQRSFWGGILAILGSSLVGLLLSEGSGIPFPRNVALLYGIAATTFFFVFMVWLRVKEPPGKVNAESVRWTTQLARGWQLLRRDRAYARYLVYQLALKPASAASAFYIVYAKVAFDIPAHMVGVYLTVRTAATILTNLIWGRLGDRHGSRLLLRIVPPLGLMMPLLALGLGGAALLWGNPSWLAYGYSAVFAASGAMRGAGGTGSSTYLLDYSPEPERPLYLGFANTLLGIGSFVGFVGGPLVDAAGHAAVMWLAVASYGAAGLLSLLLTEPRRRAPVTDTRA